MTLVEFIAPLARNKHQDRVLAVLYFHERYEHGSSLTVEGIRSKLRQTRALGWAKANIANVLSRSGALVDTDGLDGTKRLWKVTKSGADYVRSLLGMPSADPEVEHDVGTLERAIASVASEDVRDYLDEAVKCLRVGCLRACVTFVWTATIREIQTRMMANGGAAVTAALARHDPKTRTVAALEDFAYIKDITTLLAARDLRLFDKNEKDSLGEALNLRNKCGHPSRYRPGVKKVSAFVEDVTSIIFA